MVDQTKITGDLAAKLSNQLLNQSRADRDGALEEIRRSQQFQHLQDATDDDRLEERIGSVLENEKLQDKVHISDRAQALYRAREEGSEGILEKAHNRQQRTGQEPGVTPEATVFEPFTPEE